MSSSLSANPYASPADVAPPEPGLVAGVPGAPIVATLVRKDFVVRVIGLSGGIEAELEWNANWLTEFVRVNHHKVVTLRPTWYAPRFEFSLSTPDGPQDALVAVRLTRFLPLYVREFRLEIGGEVVYREDPKPRRNRRL